MFRKKALLPVKFLIIRYYDYYELVDLNEPLMNPILISKTWENYDILIRYETERFHAGLPIVVPLSTEEHSKEIE